MTRNRKTGFSREQHFVLGSQLASMEAVLHRAILDSSYVYSVAGREVRALEAVSRAIERDRSVLDDAICRERPLSDLRVIDAYYPREPAETLGVERRAEAARSNCDVRTPGSTEEHVVDSLLGSGE